MQTVIQSRHWRRIFRTYINIRMILFDFIDCIFILSLLYTGSIPYNWRQGLKEHQWTLEALLETKMNAKAKLVSDNITMRQFTQKCTTYDVTD